MTRCFTRIAAVLPVLCAFDLGAAQFRFSNQTLTVPDGFEIELIAAPPLADRPIYGSFDEQGRFYVVDSSGSNDKPAKQLEDKPHRVVRLEDTKGDGKFDKSTVFADKMMFPEGCLWHDGSLYVAAPPSIWKLTDTNHDGVADLREEWHQGKTLTGCANDLHGPCLGPDGWIYWCKGAFNEQTYERPGKSPFVSRAAHIFRARPDHSGLEPVLTGGMDNPVAVAFSADGERILCGTFFITHEPGKRDGLIHAVYGGVYGKINDVTDDHKKTGDLMPIMTHMGPAAPCSVIRYESRALGNQFEDNLFVCQFNLHKVTRHVLEPDGATFKTKDTDFLTSDNPDFHPTDVIEDADGSLLVIDTGGWYKICCPTSQLSKPDVLGAIYRVRRAGAPKMEDPRGLRIAWDKLSPSELADLLSDDRPSVCKRAMASLAGKGHDAVPALARGVSAKAAKARRNAVWTLTRIDDPGAREAVRVSLHDRDWRVRHAAVQSVGLWRDAQSSDWLLATLKNLLPPVERIIAETLGRIGDKRAIPALLELSAEQHDRVLEHSIIYALIELNDPKATAAGLKAESPFEKRAALIALDQMDEATLKPETVSPLLASHNHLLRETAAWVAGHHPEWGDALAGFFRERLGSKILIGADREELASQLGQFIGNESIQQLLGEVLLQPTTATSTRELILNVMAAARVKKAPKEWGPAVLSCLTNKDESFLRDAVAAARSLSAARTNAPNLSEPLLEISRSQHYPADLRLEALAALPNGLRTVEAAQFQFLCANLDSAKPVSTRSAAAGIVVKAKLSDDQLLNLAETVSSVGPLEVTRLLAAFERSNNEAVGLKLIDALKISKSLASLRVDAVKMVFAKYPASVREKSEELLALLNVDVAKQSAHLDELLGSVKDGDVRRGQAIFNSPKAACASCHRLGYLGGSVGPDLTNIGTVRAERDLLESIIYPSASFVRNFEPVIIRTKGDEEFSGVLKKDAADEVILATGPNTEARILRNDIADLRPGTVSVMPAGLEEQLTKQELADLVAFLKATKWGPR